MEVMRQYEMMEWTVSGREPEGSWVETDIVGTIERNGAVTEVKGFYAGNGTYKVRFLPEETGTYQVTISGSCLDEAKAFTVECAAAAEGQHGIVRAKGTHFCYEDGTWFYPFGTTVYALSHQEDAVVEQTFETLAAAPFNKIRMCVFPKHYNYNHNEPPCYAFARKADAAKEEAGYTPNDPQQWDVHRPNMALWERLESHIARLGALGIQVDLIVFHPYDRWGFSKFPRREACVYLDYLTRRLGAFPNLWWSMANEYDLLDYTKGDWECFAQFLHDHDPYHHLLSNHQMVIPWDFANENTTHICLQTSDLGEISLEISKYGKPLMIDEMCYEGNLPENWGSISGRELVRRFWIVTMQGGYATHGETFLYPDNIIWWACGRKLIGEAPERIAFLRGIIEGIGGPLTFNGRDMTKEQFLDIRRQIPMEAAAGDPILKIMLAADWEQAKGMILGSRELEGHYEEQAYIKYYDFHCTCRGTMNLPEDGAYTVEVIDTWEMTRKVALTGAGGKVDVDLPGKEGIAILATREK